MASDDTDYQRAILSTISDIARDMGEMRAKVQEDTAQLLSGYRADSHRSIMAAQMRIAEVQDALSDLRKQHTEDILERSKDKEERAKRQSDLDAKLEKMQTWHVVRFGIEIGIAVLLVVALIILAVIAFR